MPRSLTHFLPLIFFALLAVIAAIALMSTLSGDRKLFDLPSALIGKPVPGTELANLFNEQELSLNVLKPTLSLLIPIWKPFIAVMAAWALLGLSKLTNPKHLLWFVARSMNT